MESLVNKIIDDIIETEDDIDSRMFDNNYPGSINGYMIYNAYLIDRIYDEISIHKDIFNVVSQKHNDSIIAVLDEYGHNIIQFVNYVTNKIILEDILLKAIKKSRESLILKIFQQMIFIGCHEDDNYIKSCIDKKISENTLIFLLCNSSNKYINEEIIMEASEKYTSDVTKMMLKILESSSSSVSVEKISELKKKIFHLEYKIDEIIEKIKNIEADYECQPKDRKDPRDMTEFNSNLINCIYDEVLTHKDIFNVKSEKHNCYIIDCLIEYGHNIIQFVKYITSHCLLKRLIEMSISEKNYPLTREIFEQMKICKCPNIKLCLEKNVDDKILSIFK